MKAGSIRTTWDAAARSGWPEAIAPHEVAVDEEVERIFGLLGRPGRGDRLCLEVGCGVGRMTTELARRWPEVLGVDVSPEMVARAEALQLPNVRYQVVSGIRLDGVPSGCAEVIVCYSVMQHLPQRRLVATYLTEFGRTLEPGGEAVVQLPILLTDVRSRLWRIARRSAMVTVVGRRDFTASPAYRGVRVAEQELDRMLVRARLRIAARAELRDPMFPHAVNTLLLLAHA